MTRTELDRMLDGAEAVTLHLSTGDRIVLDREALMSPEAFRRAVWVQTGYRVPEYGPAKHRALVAALCALSTVEVPLAA